MTDQILSQFVVSGSHWTVADDVVTPGTCDLLTQGREEAAVMMMMSSCHCTLDTYSAAAVVVVATVVVCTVPSASLSAVVSTDQSHSAVDVILRDSETWHGESRDHSLTYSCLD